jgi:transposase
MLDEIRRDMARLAVVREQIDRIEQTRLEHLQKEPVEGSNAMVSLLARVICIGFETADLLVQGVLTRNLRDRRAIARYAGLTGSPDESGSKLRRSLIQLAWRVLRFQKDSSGVALLQRRKTLSISWPTRAIIHATF